MDKGKYVWLAQEEDDSFAEFRDSFLYDGGTVTLEITADYQFAAYVNGAFAANSQYADLPDYKVVSRYDISGLCRMGENTLTVKAYHPAADYSQSYKMTACVRFCVFTEEQTLVASSEKTLCRQDTAYSPGGMLTPQLGVGYCYDFTAREASWYPAKVLFPGYTEVDKPIENTYLLDMPAKPAVSGAYILTDGDTAGQKMQRAWQKPLCSMLDKFPVTVESQEGDGIYLLIDLEDERAGYPYLSVTSEEDAVAYLGWGEHLTDGRIRTEISVRSFAVTLRLKAGLNQFSDYLRRIGARYLCLYVQSKRPVTVHKAGVYEERYPFRYEKKDFGDRLLNRLYEAGRRTLELCAHQHYEDCPWREQALYGMDSRNQMLFGYSVFGEYRYPRANLLLMAKSLGEDGLLHLCPPSRNSITIPSFSAYWVMACCENAQAEFDAGFLREVLPATRRVMEVFRSHTKDGMVHTLGKKRYWNFHEWCDGLDEGGPHRPDDVEPMPDAPLTAICCRAAQALAVLEELAGNTQQSRDWSAYAQELGENFVRFYVPEKGLFASYLTENGPQGFHELTQTLMLFTGCLQGVHKQQVVHALQHGADMVPITLSGMALKYEGLLKYADARAFVLEDMVRSFAPMLDAGTTYWETALGQRDFDNAGSMCHGWSSVPCYVLDQLYSPEKA